MPYITRPQDEGKLFSYANPVRLGEGTDFFKFLNSVSCGGIYHDPAPTLYLGDHRDAGRTKGRNQFRIQVRNISTLYNNFTVGNVSDLLRG